MGLFIDHSDASGAGRAGLAGAARGGLAGAQRGGLALQASRLLVILGSFPAVLEASLARGAHGCRVCLSVSAAALFSFDENRCLSMGSVEILMILT